MRKKNWTRQYPASLKDAIRLCLDYALHKKNYSVARVADLMGSSESSIYKWLARGSMPASKIRTLEYVCGCSFITEYFAGSCQKLLIDIPRGIHKDEESLLEMNHHFNETLTLLGRFYKGEAEANETIAALTDTLKRLAGHRENVGKCNDPELALFGEDK